MHSQDDEQVNSALLHVQSVTNKNHIFLNYTDFAQLFKYTRRYFVNLVKPKI